jgi:hypothetical protein
VQQISDRPQLLVMEVVSCSAPLEGHEGAAALLKVGGDGAEARLRTMGRVLAVDVFLNNSDRIVAPCWDNDGNGGNLLLCRGADAMAGLVPIDSVVTAIAPSAPNAYFTKYQARVKVFLESVCSDATGSGVSLADVRRFVENNTGAVLSDDDLAIVRLGAREGIAQIVGRFALSPGEAAAGRDRGLTGKLQELRHQCVAAIAADWQDVWALSVGLIDGEFLRAMVETFSEAAQGHTLTPTVILPPLPPQHATPLSAAEGGAEDDPARPPNIKRSLWQALPDAYKNPDGDVLHPQGAHGNHFAVNPKSSRFGPGGGGNFAEELSARNAKAAESSRALAAGMGSRPDIGAMLASRNALTPAASPEAIDVPESAAVVTARELVAASMISRGVPPRTPF